MQSKSITVIAVTIAILFASIGYCLPAEQSGGPQTGSSPQKAVRTKNGAVPGTGTISQPAGASESGPYRNIFDSSGETQNTYPGKNGQQIDNTTIYPFPRENGVNTVTETRKTPPLRKPVTAPQSVQEPFPARTESYQMQKLSVRIKDITHVRGVCDNQLVGYGIVAGLNGTGDRKGLPDKTILNVLKNLGINTLAPSDFKPKNMAAVMVTASLPPFSKSGDTIDVMVSSIGDAKSIEGGVLFLTQLKAANGAVFATAQGPVSIGGLNSTMSKGGKSTMNYALVGTVNRGGLICRDMSTDLTRDNMLSLALDDPDFNTASKIADTINTKLGSGTASAIDAQTVIINSPCANPGDAVSFIARINNLEFEPESNSRVVINERTGTVVVGADIRILPVAISHGSIDITIGAVRKESGSGKGRSGKMVCFENGATVKMLVDALNYIGTSPRDLISILQTLKRASVLPAELVVM